VSLRDMFPETAEKLQHIAATIKEIRAGLRRTKALDLYIKALKLDGEIIMEISLSSAIRAGFTLSKDGVKYGLAEPTTAKEPR